MSLFNDSNADLHCLVLCQNQCQLSKKICNKVTDNDYANYYIEINQEAIFGTAQKECMED